MEPITGGDTGTTASNDPSPVILDFDSLSGLFLLANAERLVPGCETPREEGIGPYS
jgi:hypothetical protein